MNGNSNERSRYRANIVAFDLVERFYDIRLVCAFKKLIVSTLVYRSLSKLGHRVL